DFGLNPAEAVTAPRFGTNHHLGSFRQRPPELGSLLLYPDFAENTVKELQGRGHKVTVRRPPLWAPTMLSIDPQTGMIHAAGDPKAGGHAAGFGERSPYRLGGPFSRSSRRSGGVHRSVTSALARAERRNGAGAYQKMKYLLAVRPGSRFNKKVNV